MYIDADTHTGYGGNKRLSMRQADSVGSFGQIFRAGYAKGYISWQ